MNDLIIFWAECVKRRRSQLAEHKKTLEEIWSVQGGTELFYIQQGWVTEAAMKLRHAEAVLQFLDEERVK